MKYQCILTMAFLIGSLSSCEQGGGVEGADPVTPVIHALSPTNISETGFQLNWSVTTQLGYSSIAIELSEDEEMDRVIKYVELNDITLIDYQLGNLKGASRYFYRLSLLNNGISVFKSGVMVAETSFHMESFKLLTEDNYELSSKLAYLESVSGSRPGIILMHEFGVWVNPWVGSDILKQLVSEGYVCLTFFFRGHGTSTPVDNLMDLINDKSLLANDLKAAIGYLNGHELVSAGELGLMGGSMGATMALAGNGFEEVKTSVALSPGSDGVLVIFPGMTLSSVYYLVGELDIHEDPAVNFPAEASSLFDLTEEPKKLDLIAGTSDHGSNLLSRDSLNTSVKNWILESLPLN